MKLFHGSDIEISQIDLSKSKVGKDFGVGFYLSPNEKQARELAERKVEQLGLGKAVVSAFIFDEAGAEKSGLKIKRFFGYTPEWAEFILLNRKNSTKIQVHEYDIVIGPIANDRVGFQIRRFSAGIINIEKFIEELKFMGGITYQYFFSTEKALKFLKKI